MKIPLTKQQNEIMQNFYGRPKQKVIFNKRERNNLWKKATARTSDIDFDLLREKCPALEHQIQKSYRSQRNIQSAVFSECVYAQTLANMMKLNVFVNCSEITDFIPEDIMRLLYSYHLVARYVYSTADKKEMLIQAGGCDGVDSALITVTDLTVHTIEFKEPSAKTCEPDLPCYAENGKLLVTAKWLESYPQFKAMLDEQKNLNFFKSVGHNIKNFSNESIDVAVSECYTRSKKIPDVICTEDKRGYLVMIPTNQASVWADIEGEIRPAGRNHCKVWTPNALKNFLLQMGACINNNTVTINKSVLEERRERGGNRRVSGYKINPLFFVYVRDCIENNGILTFDLNKIQQVKPTIAGKMFFKNLLYNEVKTYYGL